MREVPGRLVLVENQRQSQAIGHSGAFYRVWLSVTRFVRLAYVWLAHLSSRST
jgi:hypothetical protein